jgi:hypothetical protein
MNIEIALEMASCAEIFLKNLVKMHPGLELDPFVALTKAQLRSCIEELEKEE